LSPFFGGLFSKPLIDHGHNFVQQLADGISAGANLSMAGVLTSCMFHWQFLALDLSWHPIHEVRGLVRGQQDTIPRDALEEIYMSQGLGGG